MDNVIREPAFMMDHMLVRVGKYLRISGFDAEWNLGLRTQDLIRQANAEGRVFLTRNGHIPENHPRPADWLQVRSNDPVGQFREIVARFGLDPRALLFRKCIRCNVFLEDVPDRHAIEGAVHPNVFARYERFYRCPLCRTIFWRGSHVENTCRKLGLKAPG